MEVRNTTGIKQVDSSSGVVLPSTPLDEWIDVPMEVAMRFWRMRTVELRHQDQVEGRRLWKEKDGLHVFWASPFSLGDGYGTAAAQTVLALDTYGIKIHPAWCWFHSFIGVDDRVVKLVQEPLPGPMSVGICMATPGEFRKLPTPYKIGYTMYESDDPLRNLPEWRHDCAIIDMLWVPSEYSRQVFGSFVKAPIQVVPLIANPYFKVSPEERIRRKGKKFVFGMHGTLIDRKSPIELVAAFLKAFPKEQDVELQLKTRLGAYGVCQSPAPAMPDPRIKLIDDNWLLPELRKWLVRTVDCYVFPSKGEGFGMPPREAMLAGCPTILSNNTGMVDFANADYNWPIPVHHSEDSPLGGEWRIPDWDALVETMRWVYDHKDVAAAKGLLGSEWYSTTFGPQPVAHQIATILDQIDPQKTRAPIPSPEGIGKGLGAQHGPFYDMLAKQITAGGTVMDLGFGDGVFYEWAVQHGYSVVAVVEPRKVESVKNVIAAAGLPVNVIGSPLWEVHKLDFTPEAIVSDGVFQYYQQHEIELILRSALTCGAKTFFSVPTVYYPVPYGEHAKLRRRGHWEDILADFEYEGHYYGGKRYLWFRVYRLDQGLRATTVRQAETRGNVIDGTWHPNPVPWTKPGIGTRAEQC